MNTSPFKLGDLVQVINEDSINHFEIGAVGHVNFIVTNFAFTMYQVIFVSPIYNPHTEKYISRDSFSEHNLKKLNDKYKDLVSI